MQQVVWWVWKWTTGRGRSFGGERLGRQENWGMSEESGIREVDSAVLVYSYGEVV